MKMTKSKKLLSFLLCIMLIAAAALFTSGCKDNSETPKNTEATETDSTIVQPEGGELGEGDTEFFLLVVDADENETEFTIHTDKKTVGEALTDVNLIRGEEGPYGLFVKTVNGITVDFDEDGLYWAFYMNDEYAVSGVDTTEITSGATYALKAEK